MQDRTLLAQQLMLWRRWSLRFSPIRPTALTWRQAISISFLISRGFISPEMMKWSKLWRRGSNKELLNSSLTTCVNLFYVGKNVLNDKATMSKNKYVNLWLKYFTLLPTFVCLNTWSLLLDISLCITYRPPLLPSFWYGQIRRNLVCMLATWNSVNRMKNE
jgi:hypothetical protein